MLQLAFHLRQKAEGTMKSLFRLQGVRMLLSESNLNLCAEEMLDVLQGLLNARWPH